MEKVKERNLKITVEKPEFEIPLVWCDADKITHVVSNLLDNAVFYTFEGGINVSYELLKGFLKINVRIPAAAFPKPTGENLPKILPRHQRSG
jgi:signal transduction histidine kinase